MADKKSVGSQVVAIILVLILLGVVIGFMGWDVGFKDLFADTVEGDESIPIYSPEYIEIIRYINTTIWTNATEYLPIWINTTEYIPMWYNNTLWINDTIWINTTEIVEIEIIEYLPYPFEDKWNVTGYDTFCRVYKNIGGGGGATYRIDFYNQLSTLTTSTNYMSLVNLKTQMGVYLTNGDMSQQQYDCLYVQIFILNV